MSENLYQSIKHLREQQKKPYYRIMLAGYFNDQIIKRDNLNVETYLKNTMTGFENNISGYLYIKGLFYLHLIEADNIGILNKYLEQFNQKNNRKKQLHNQIRIVYQSYQNLTNFFNFWECDYIAQSGPILIETQKTQQQIADRIRRQKKKENSSHKLANMILLSNDDMSILISNFFMTLQEYCQIYIGEVECQKQAEVNYPLPPSIFNIIQFLEIDNYLKFQ